MKLVFAPIIISFLHRTSPDRSDGTRSEGSGVPLLQSAQSAPPTAGPGQYEIPIDSMKRNRPPLGYTSVQFTPRPTILAGVPSATDGDHDYESVKFTRSTTESVEAVQRSGDGGVLHYQPASLEPGYELMESARHGEASAVHSVRYVTSNSPTFSEAPVSVQPAIVCGSIPHSFLFFLLGTSGVFRQ